MVVLLYNMRHDKSKVFELRKSGKSYREIQKIIQISRNTLSVWFRNEEWSSHLKSSNIEKNRSPDHLMKMRIGRRVLLDKQYAEVEEIARKEFESYKERPLFMAGLMLYAGEGDKLSSGVIRLANTDFHIHKIFINFITTFMGIKRESLRCSVLLYPDLNIENCKIKWSQELNIPLTQFHKPQVIQGRHKTRKLHFGVGSTIISGSFLKSKLLLWIDLAKNTLAK